MAIPDFGDKGLLEPTAAFAEWRGKTIYSGHPCDLAEVKARFVGKYPQSLTRPALFGDLETHVDQVKKSLDCFLIVVSGEFVTDTENPHDIFVALDVVGEALDGLSGDEIWLLDRLFNAQERPWGSDDALTTYTGIMRAYPPDHLKFELGNSERMLQRHMASSPIPDVDSAGYLEILECERGLDLDDAIFTPPSDRD
jgi:hypothetical protein